MPTKFLVFLFVLSVCDLSFSQKENSNNEVNADRINIGGNFALSFGTITNVNISPSVSYQLTDIIDVGVGGIYTYYKSELPFDYYETTIYGGNMFANLLVIPDLGELIPIFTDIGIFAHIEYELLSLENSIFASTPPFDGRSPLNSILVGGGIRQYMGISSYLDLIVLWNLSHIEQELPYTVPTFRFGIYF